MTRKTKKQAPQTKKLDTRALANVSGGAIYNGPSYPYWYGGGGTIGR